MSTEFILLINVKMPTIVGILTFIGRINIHHMRASKHKNFYLVCVSVFMSSLNFMLIELSTKKVL